LKTEGHPSSFPFVFPETRNFFFPPSSGPFFAVSSTLSEDQSVPPLRVLASQRAGSRFSRTPFLPLLCKLFPLSEDRETFPYFCFFFAWDDTAFFFASFTVVGYPPAAAWRTWMPGGGSPFWHCDFTSPGAYALCSSSSFFFPFLFFVSPLVFMDRPRDCPLAFFPPPSRRKQREEIFFSASSAGSTFSRLFFTLQKNCCSYFAAPASKKGCFSPRSSFLLTLDA